MLLPRHMHARHIRYRICDSTPCSSSPFTPWLGGACVPRHNYAHVVACTCITYAENSVFLQCPSPTLLFATHACHAAIAGPHHTVYTSTYGTPYGDVISANTFPMPCTGLLHRTLRCPLYVSMSMILSMPAYSPSMLAMHKWHRDMLCRTVFL